MLHVAKNFYPSTSSQRCEGPAKSRGAQRRRRSLWHRSTTTCAFPLTQHRTQRMLAPLQNAESLTITRNPKFKLHSGRGLRHHAQPLLSSGPDKSRRHSVHPAATRRVLPPHQLQQGTAMSHSLRSQHSLCGLRSPAGSGDNHQLVCVIVSVMACLLQCRGQTSTFTVCKQLAVPGAVCPRARNLSGVVWLMNLASITHPAHSLPSTEWSTKGWFSFVRFLQRCFTTPAACYSKYDTGLGSHDCHKNTHANAAGGTG